MKLAREEAVFRRNLEKEEQRHRQEMDRRIWRTKLIGMIGGLLCIAALIAVAWRYAESGNILPGVAYLRSEQR